MNARPVVLQFKRLDVFESGRSNNLLLIRALLAAGVILSHCYLLVGRYAGEPLQRWLHFEDLGGIAVYSFFFLSGFLITKSGLTSPTTTDYVRARMLRIFPALLFAVCACAFLLGPAVTTQTTAAYFHSPQTWGYLKQGVLHSNSMRLPGVFTYSKVFPTVDQPLWTLSSEWLMYVLVLAGCIIWRLRQNLTLSPTDWIVLLGTLLLTVQMLPFQRLYTMRWGMWFVAGSLCYLLRRFIVLSVPAAAAVVLLDIAAIRLAPHVGKGLFVPALCYALLVAAYHPALDVAVYRRHLGDYSYGLYIFGWPVQQYLLPRAEGDPIRHFLLSFPPALVLAVVSWHTLEKPMLKLKRKRKAQAAADRETVASPAILRGS